MSQPALYGLAWELHYISISIWGNTLRFKMTCKWVPEPQSPVNFRSLCPGHWGTWAWSPLLVFCTIWPILEMQAVGTMSLTELPQRMRQPYRPSQAILLTWGLPPGGARRRVTGTAATFSCRLSICLGSCFPFRNPSQLQTQRAAEGDPGPGCVVAGEGGR